MSFFSDLGSLVNEATTLKDDIMGIRDQSVESIEQVASEATETLSTSAGEVTSTIDQAIQEIKQQ